MRRKVLLLDLLLGIGDHGHRSNLAAGSGGGGYGEKGNVPPGGEHLAAHQRFNIVGVLADDHPDALCGINDAAAAHGQNAVTALLLIIGGNLIDHGNGAVGGNVGEYGFGYRGGNGMEHRIHGAYLL